MRRRYRETQNAMGYCIKTINSRHNPYSLLSIPEIPPTSQKYQVQPQTAMTNAMVVPYGRLYICAKYIKAMAVIKLNIMSTIRVATEASITATPVGVSAGTAPVSKAVILGTSICSKNNIVRSRTKASNTAIPMSTAKASKVRLDSWPVTLLGHIEEGAPNDEVERRGASPTTNEADLSQSSTPSLAHRRRDPRSLELLDTCAKVKTEVPRHCSLKQSHKPVIHFMNDLITNNPRHLCTWYLGDQSQEYGEAIFYRAPRLLGVRREPRVLAMQVSVTRRG
jgi:hypothetical protein